jgi:hypothetical protein
MFYKVVPHKIPRRNDPSLKIFDCQEKKLLPFYTNFSRFQYTDSFPESGSRKHFQGSGMRAIDYPRVQKFMRFGTLFDKSKKISKRGFLALTKKINFSTLRIENFAKMTSPIDSPPKITYRYVQSSRFELFFHEKTADARFLPIKSQSPLYVLPQFLSRFSDGKIRF